tara:strand:+ start:562 stop:1362 length:801 start_codon:yes stop_codon:yes gene_type:complete
MAQFDNGTGSVSFGDLPTRGSDRGQYQDVYDQIKAYQDLAGVPSEAEKNRYKLDADRAKSLRGRRSGIEALMPTAEQYGHRQKGVGFDALAGFLSRTGSPNDMPVGQMGERIRAESSRQLGERLGFEDKLAGIDTDIYGVEGGSLDQQGARQRAGEVYNEPHLKTLLSEAESDAQMNIARAKARQEGNPFRPQNLAAWASVLDSDAFLQGEPLYNQLASSGTNPEELQAQIVRGISQMTQGGGGGPSGYEIPDILTAISRADPSGR